MYVCNLSITSAWNAEGRRLLWKDNIEGKWQEAIVKAPTECNPTYLELGRGVGGWLRYASLSRPLLPHNRPLLPLPHTFRIPQVCGSV